MINIQDEVSREVAMSLMEDARSYSKERSGFFGQIKSKSDRKKFDPMAHIKEHKPEDVLITIGCKTAVIPGSWYTKSGKVRKGHLEEYTQIFAELRKDL